MLKIFLVIAFLNGTELEVVRVYHMDSLGSCEHALSTQAVRASWQDVLPGKQIQMWCENRR